MQTLFEAYFSLGFSHILDPKGYDHIAFLIALCATFPPGQWKRVALLATAFTIGHSLTLGLAAVGILPVNQELTETLIPVTILLTAIYNVTLANTNSQSGMLGNYGIALGFGLIHGMGFSNFFKGQLPPGREGDLLYQLLYFNIGVEVGQLIIVLAILILAAIAFNLLNVQQKSWNLFISGMASGIAISLLL